MPSLLWKIQCINAKRNINMAFVTHDVKEEQLKIGLVAS